MNRDIMVCGVGGQGTVLASKIVSAASMRAGLDVHSAETIGMAQRGGSVTSHIRIGDNVYSPLIPQGCADMIMSFEPAEAVRNLVYLKQGGIVITNSIPTKPVTESLLKTGYDGQEMLKYLGEKCQLIVVDADKVCEEFGSTKFFNIAILGVAVGTGRLGISADDVLAEIEARVPERFLDINKKAFVKGIDIGKNYEIK